MQRYLSFPTSTHHPLKIPLSTLLLISLLLMIKITCLIVSHISSLTPSFGKLPSIFKINSWFENICFKKKSLQKSILFLFSVIYTITTISNKSEYVIMFKQQFLLSVNENFGLHTKKYFRTWNLQIQKQQYF